MLYPRSLIGSVIRDVNSHKIIDAAINLDWSTGKFSQNLKIQGQSYIDSGVLTTKGTIYPVSIFTTIGNFNYLRLPHYLSDYEFACRARRNGYQLLIATKSVVMNDSTRTGQGDRITSIPGIINILKLAFSRKSKQNVIDHFNFISLCCPPKYVAKNYLILITKLINLILGK